MCYVFSLPFLPVHSLLADEDEPSASPKLEIVEKAAYRTETLRGKVVWLAEALSEDFGVSSVPEASDRVLAVKTTTGQLLPLVENIRGRAFRKDARLFEMELEILVRRYERHPFVQILRMFELKGGKRFEVDYWCDVCAIPMYESGPCSCCQDDNRLRRRDSTGAESYADDNSKPGSSPGPEKE